MSRYILVFNINCKNVKKIKLDIRKNIFDSFKNIDVVINLAYLSNDPLCEIPLEIGFKKFKIFKKFSWSMNETNTQLKARVEVTSTGFERGGGTLFF